MLVMLLQADRGTVHLELRFVPFKKAGDQITGTDDKGEPEMSRTLTKGAAKPEHKGVLTVTLVKGSALVVSWQLYAWSRPVPSVGKHMTDTCHVGVRP